MFYFQHARPTRPHPSTYSRHVREHNILAVDPCSLLRADLQITRNGPSAHLPATRGLGGTWEGMRGDLVLCAHLYRLTGKLVRAQYTHLRGAYMFAPEMCFV